MNMRKEKTTSSLQCSAVDDEKYTYSPWMYTNYLAFVEIKMPECLKILWSAKFSLYTLYAIRWLRNINTFINGWGSTWYPICAIQ